MRNAKARRAHLGRSLSSVRLVLSLGSYTFAHPRTLASNACMSHYAIVLHSTPGLETRGETYKRTGAICFAGNCPPTVSVRRHDSPNGASELCSFCRPATDKFPQDIMALRSDVSMPIRGHSHSHL